MKEKFDMIHKPAAIALLLSAAFAQAAGTTDAAAQAQLDTLQAKADSLSEFAGSTLIGKDDAPVAVSGYMAMRMKNFYYDKTAPLQYNDRARTLAQGTLNLAVYASPSSNVNLWTNLMVPFDMSGYFGNAAANDPNSGYYNTSERVLGSHHTDYYGITLDEELTAGIDVRAGGVGAMFKAGGVLWASSSPLTMWERETGIRFPSQYELFEEEKTVSTYYKEKTFRPVKEGGRAFWTNRSFGGLELDLYQLPGDMQAQFILSQPADMDAGTRDGTRMLGGQPGELEMQGTLDMRGGVYHGRIAKQKLFNNVVLGANYLGVTFDRDIVYEPEFSAGFTNNGMDPVLVNNHVASIDIKGDMIPNLFVMADFAMSWDDSTKFKRNEQLPNKYEQDYYTSATSSFTPGFYTKIQSKHWEPITLEAVYLPKNFFSPYGMTDNSRFRSWRSDEFFLGAGTFRYGPNMTGINLKVEPVFNRGRFDFQYGQHKQLEEGSDVVVFKYNLNGRSMWESTNSWTKHKPLFTMDSGNGSAAARYIGRAGIDGPYRKFTNQKGGIYGGTWEAWESFVPYENASQIDNEDVPEHAKWSSVVSVDAGYDIGNWFGTSRNIMLAAYGVLQGVSTEMVPVSYSEDQSGMLLWSAYVQSEPSIEITPTFHGLLILGFETWRANQAYVRRSITNTASNTGSYYPSLGGAGYYYEYAPINYLQTALGFGFDWDFTDRAGLHVRYKRATHSDQFVPENDWKSHIVTAETKVWF